MAQEVGDRSTKVSSGNGGLCAGTPARSGGAARGSLTEAALFAATMGFKGRLSSGGAAVGGATAGRPCAGEAAAGRPAGVAAFARPGGRRKREFGLAGGRGFGESPTARGEAGSRAAARGEIGASYVVAPRKWPTPKDVTTATLPGLAMPRMAVSRGASMWVVGVTVQS